MKLSFFCHLYKFPRPIIINHHELGSIKQQKFILLEFKRLEVWNQSISRADSFWRLWGRIYSLYFLPCFCWLLGIPWLLDTALQFLSLSLHGVSLLYSHSPFIRTPVVGFRALLIQYDLILMKLITSVKTLFHISSQSEVPGRHEF